MRGAAVSGERAVSEEEEEEKSAVAEFQSTDTAPQVTPVTLHPLRCKASEMACSAYFCAPGTTCHAPAKHAAALWIAPLHEADLSNAHTFRGSHCFASLSLQGPSISPS
eukprot:1483882-Rhodomonas_salina.1